MSGINIFIAAPKYSAFVNAVLAVLKGILFSNPLFLAFQQFYPHRYFPTLRLWVKSSRVTFLLLHFDINFVVAENTAVIKLHFSSLQTALKLWCLQLQKLHYLLLDSPSWLAMFTWRHWSCRRAPPRGSWLTTGPGPSCWSSRTSRSPPPSARRQSSPRPRPWQ